MYKIEQLNNYYKIYDDENYIILTPTIFTKDGIKHLAYNVETNCSNDFIISVFSNIEQYTELRVDELSKKYCFFYDWSESLLNLIDTLISDYGYKLSDTHDLIYISGKNK